MLDETQTCGTHQISLGSDLEPERDVALADCLDERAVSVAHADLFAPPPVVSVKHVRRTVLDDLGPKSWSRFQHEITNFKEVAPGCERTLPMLPGRAPGSAWQRTE